MGIVISVASIISPASHSGAGPLQLRQVEEFIVSEICRVFEWQALPWEEPSNQRGTNVSRSRSFQEGLWRSARLFEDMAGDRGVAGRRSERGFSRGPSLLFPHLLESDEYTNIYIPVDFLKPLNYSEGPFTWASYASFSVGSSRKLLAELLELQERAVVFMRANKNPVLVERQPIWDQATQSSCSELLELTRESINLNLPLQLRW